MIGVVASRFNSIITERLVEGVKGKLEEAGVPYEVIWVPGSFELPQAISLLWSRYEAFVAVGCIVKGETAHWEYLSSAVISSLMDLAVKGRKPIGLAVLTVSSIEQGLNRAGGKFGNKGEEAAEAVLNLLRLRDVQESGPEG